MKESSVKPQIDEARQCHKVVIGHWLTWVNLQFHKPFDAALLLELEA